MTGLAFSRSPRNILISHVYSADNKGDAALLSVLIEELRTVFPNAELRVHTLDDVRPGEQFEGVPVGNSLMHHVLRGQRSRLVKLCLALVMMSWTRLWAMAHTWLHIRLPLPRAWRQPMADYAAADVVVGVGGGYLRGRNSWSSTIELLLLTHPLHLASALGTPTVLSSMSVGPVAGRWQRRILTKGINRVEAVFVREDVSQDLLASLDITVPFVRAIDSGFAFTSNRTIALRAMLDVDPGTPLVGITVRKWLPADEQATYERAVAMAADHLIDAHGAAVVFVPQVTSIRNNDDDRIASRDVHALMVRQAQANVLTESEDHHYIKALCAELDLMLGTRFHSVIFSLTSLVPCVAIEYEHKTAGIMAELDLSEWVIRMEDVDSPRLIALIDQAMTQREAYRSYLADVIPAYIERCTDTRDQLLALGRATGRSRALKDHPPL